MINNEEDNNNNQPPPPPAETINKNNFIIPKIDPKNINKLFNDDSVIYDKKHSDFTVEDNTGNITTLYYSDTSGIRPWRIQQLRQPTPLTRLHIKLSIEF